MEKAEITYLYRVVNIIIVFIYIILSLSANITLYVLIFIPLI